MQIRRTTIRLLAGTAVDGALATVCFRLHLNLATVALLFVLSVVVQALQLTFAGSVAAALIAAAFVDFFFIAPLFTWRISDAFDLAALTAFVGVALITSHLASNARGEAETAERRSKLLDQLYLLSQKILRLAPGEGSVTGILRMAGETFGLRGVCLFDAQTAELHCTGVSSPLASRTYEAYIRGNDGTSDGTVTMCIRKAGNVRGAIGFEGFGDAGIAPHSLAALVIASVDRIHAMESAATATAEAKAEVFRTVILDAMAHEFKTPIAVIAAAAGGLQESDNLTSVQRDIAAEIENEAVRLGELTSSLLGKHAGYKPMEARLATTDLRLLVASILETFTSHHRERNIEYVRNLPDPLYAAVDNDLLRLALNQLLDNAIKYSQPESRIEVSVTQSGAGTEIRVRNNGSTIPAAEQEMIFQRFYRGARQRHIAPGSGLGLYVARKIAIAHGGTLTVDARAAQDEGVTFLMTLPRSEEDFQYAGITVQSAGCR